MVFTNRPKDTESLTKKAYPLLYVLVWARGGNVQPFVIDDKQSVRAVLTPDREEKRQNGRRMKEDGEPMFTLTAQDRHGIAIEGGQTPINTNSDGTSRCICAGLYKQNWSHFDPTREKQTYTGVVVNETNTNKVCETEKG